MLHAFDFERNGYSHTAVTGQEPEAAASVPARYITFDCSDEAVGVDEADRQRTDLTPEEQCAGLPRGVAGRLDDELDQALIRAVHEPAPAAAVYPDCSPDRARRARGRSHRAARDVQMEISHPHPHHGGVDLHATASPAP